MITYRHTLEDITPDQLGGFFDGWSNPPSKEIHFNLLRNSDEVILAIEEDSEKVVGFITAITDGVLSAYIPFIEVLKNYRGEGIGKKLFRLMIDRLAEYYMIDLLCDEDLQEFYEKLGMIRAKGMMIRNYGRQSGERASDTE